MITDEKGSFESSELQLLPRISMGSKPLSLFSGRYVRNLLWTLSANYHHFDSVDSIRNDTKEFQRVLAHSRLESDFEFSDGIQSKLSLTSDFGKYYFNQLRTEGDWSSFNLNLNTRLGVTKKIFH